MLFTIVNSYFNWVCLLFFIVFKRMFVVSQTPKFSAIFFNTDRSFSFPYKYNFLFQRWVHFEQHFGWFFNGYLSGSGSKFIFCSLSPSSYIFFLFFTPLGRPLDLLPCKSSQLSYNFTVSYLDFEFSLLSFLLIY